MSRLSHLAAIPVPSGYRTRKASGTDRERYRVHGLNAKRRGVPFLLTFDEWIGWWRETGHYHEYGKKRGQYVMARKGDIGPYAIGNLECMQAQENSTAAHRGKPKSNEWKAKLRKSLASKRNGENRA